MEALRGDGDATGLRNGQRGHPAIVPYATDNNAQRWYEQNR